MSVKIEVLRKSKGSGKPLRQLPKALQSFLALSMSIFVPHVFIHSKLVRRCKLLELRSINYNPSHVLQRQRLLSET